MPAARLALHDRPDRARRRRPSAAELDALRAAIGADLPAYLADLERARQHRLRQLHAATASTRSGAGSRRSWPSSARRSSAGPTRRAGSATRSWRRSTAGRAARGPCSSATWTRSSTRARRPSARSGSRTAIAYGPGVTDMKSGLLAGLYALKAIIAERGGLPFERLVVRRQPRRGDRLADLDPAHPRRSPPTSDVALVLECARANGDIVSARKGILDLRITVHGRAAHAGVEPEKGRSAILEAARIVARPARPQRPLAGRDRQRRGRSPAGRGPTSSPERCSLEVDVRATARDALEAAEAEIRRHRRGDRGPRHDRRVRADGALVADGEARAQRPPGRARPGRRRTPRLRGRRRLDRRRVGRQHDVRAWASRPSTASGRSAATTTPRPSTSRSTRSCRGRRCWPACCSPSPPTRRSSPGATEREARRHDRAPADLVGRAVGGRSPATAGRSPSAIRAGSRARRTPGPTAGRAIRATSRRRRGRSSRSSSARSARPGSGWPTSSGRGCS